ncbi:MAG: hypothetical protein OXI67_08180 [Candidatus Poribacteria bacterium]|nr:hypothetical protein [Candidatus Poribacteria bacterium]
MELFIILLLGAIFCGLAGIVSEIRKVDRQLTEITQTFKNIDESISKIENTFSEFVRQTKN